MQDYDGNTALKGNRSYCNIHRVPIIHEYVIDLHLHTNMVLLKDKPAVFQHNKSL